MRITNYENNFPKQFFLVNTKNHQLGGREKVKWDLILDLMAVPVLKKMYFLRKIVKLISKTKIEIHVQIVFWYYDFDFSPTFGSPTYIVRVRSFEDARQSLIQFWRSEQPEIVKSIHGKICVNDVPARGDRLTSVRSLIKRRRISDATPLPFRGKGGGWINGSVFLLEFEPSPVLVINVRAKLQVLSRSHRARRCTAGTSSPSYETR